MTRPPGNAPEGAFRGLARPAACGRLGAEHVRRRQMARDILGWRKLFGVMGPSTNTVVQPDYDMMRPAGVTTHYARIFTPMRPPSPTTASAPGSR